MSIYASLKSINISMIGCGPVGVSFLYQLRNLSQNFKKIKIYIFSKSSHASGYAYTTDNNNFLLNAQSSEMSVDPNSPSDFIKWLKINYPNENNILVSRHIFGVYLKNTLETLLNNSGSDFELNFIEEEVIDCIVNNKNKVTVITRNRILEAQYVVFCHGAINRDIYPELKKHKNFIYDFYQDMHFMHTIKENSRILFIGSSLSMVDASLLLKENNRQYDLATIW
jgi:uncharacterized NAD(P)/FAD-binding protein YdhS